MDKRVEAIARHLSDNNYEPYRNTPPDKQWTHETGSASSIIGIDPLTAVAQQMREALVHVKNMARDDEFNIQTMDQADKAIAAYDRLTQQKDRADG